ncbi:hypothetical protein R6Q59_006924 [Mikania micrantha]
MAQSIFGEIVAPVVKKMSNHITKALGYVIYSSKHVNDMKEQLRVLKNTKVDVKKRMETNTLNNTDVPSGVPDWVIKVETLKQVESISSEGYGCLNIKMRYRVGKKACEATERIKYLTTENNAFVWTDAPIPTGRVDSKRATSTPSSHGDNFKSRDRPFNEALKWLQQDNNESQVIALCGMGGVGKTTMMEQLRTVANGKNMFNYIVPVVIGRTPNMHYIQNDISIRLSGKGLVEANIPERADRLREKFKECLEVKKERILFILDDVWNKIELKDIGLTSPLPNGLKLFLTSRDSDICRQIAVSAHSYLSFKVVEVEVLTEEEAQNLFFKITNVSKEDKWYDIGCQIVEKCGRLPLAINIIGTALHFREIHAWNFKLQRLNNNNIDDDLQEVIKISYEYRDKKDKEVLLLCGLFPEDYDIRIEDLTCYAWGLNLFIGVSTLGDARDSTKTCVGNLINAHLLINSNKHGCVRMHDLVLSFVLGVVSKSDRAWIINHGNVIQLTGREEMVRESCKRISLTCMGMSEFPQDFKYPNLSLLQLKNGDFSLKFPEDFYENMKNLQVIAYYNMQHPLLPRSLHCSTNLKSLCLYKCTLMFDISFVGDLVNVGLGPNSHQKTLTLGLPFSANHSLDCFDHRSRSSVLLLSIRKLGRSRCPSRLQFFLSQNGLAIAGAFFLPARLPSAIGKLAKLKLLELTECMGIIIDWVGLNIDNGVFENLKNLEELYMNVGSQHHIRFTDSNFEELAMISKQLRALDIDFFMKKNQMENFSFDKLDIFNIAINGFLRQDCSEKNSRVLKLMNDCSSDLHDCNINKLFKKTEILCLRVKDMIGLEEILVCPYDQHSFSSLKELEVYNCSKLKYLFPICVTNGLKKLEKLKVVRCDVLEALMQNDGREINGVVELPQLLDLNLDDLPNFTSIYPVNNNICSLFDIQVKFAKLEKLRIRNMKKLKQIWGYESDSSEEEEVNNVSMLIEIEVLDCDSLVNLFSINQVRLLTHLERVQVERCGSVKELFNINLECVGHEIENNISMLREIRVNGCKNLVNLFPANPMRLLTHLESLIVANCGSIKELFNIDQECLSNEVENNVFMLREIKVEKCDRLENLFPTNSMRTLNHLERLEVRDCGSIEVIFNIDLGYEFAQVSMNNLRSIDVSGSKNVIELWRIKSGEKNFTSICGFESVEVIRIEGCSNVFTTSNFNTKFDMKAVSKESRDDNIHTVAFPSILYFHSLRDLRLSKCEGMEVVFEIDVNNQQPLLTKLQRLQLVKMNDMSHVWKCNNWNKYLLIPQRHYHSFHRLTSITIHECNRIKYLFSPLMAKLLSNLQSIEIRMCDDMEEVVSNRDDDNDDKDEEEMSSTSTTTTFFPHLQSLTFVDLPNLTRIGGGGGGAKGTKTSVIQHKVSHVGVVSWCLCQFSKEIKISSCNGLSSVIPLDAIGQMQKLEVLRVTHCKSLKEVFESQYINGNSSDSKSSININKGSVDINAISRQPNINRARLSNLKILEIISCNLLQHVFTFSMLESLKHLEELKLKDCKAMKVIVEKENGEDRKDVVFPCLKLLELYRLPNLEGFFLGMNNFNWPLLEKVKIIECPQMMNFTCGQSTTRVLKGIHTNLGRHSLECGLNFHHLKIHQDESRNSESRSWFSHNLIDLQHLLASSESRSWCCNTLPTWSFHNLIDLQMVFVHNVKCTIPSNELLQLQKLETIRVDDCGYVEEVFEVEGANEATNSELEIVVEIPNLRLMNLWSLKSLKYIWKSNQRKVLKFPNLTTLSICGCYSLKHVFTSSMVGGLLQLQHLHVSWCYNMEVIVKTEEEEDEVKEEMELFPCLKSLRLDNLKSLKGFCSGKVNFSWPLLHTLKVPAYPEITDMLRLQH